MITTELVLVRHGEAQCNVDGLVGGPATCTGLTALGRAQMESTAIHLATEHRQRPFAALYSGPRLRLRDSGRILARHLDLPLTVESGLDGPVHGEADGRSWYDVKTAADGGPEMHPDRAWAVGSETWNGYLRRSCGFLHELVIRHDGDRLLLAAHGETILSAHALLLGLAPGTTTGFTISHGSLTRWQRHRNRLGQQRWVLDRHNDTGHLPKTTSSS
ncbi:histidine phosphatase family protein [Embleya sp. NPDC055664]